MDLFQLKQDIKQGDLLKLYIFTGPEVTIMDNYINQIVKKSGKTLCRAGSIDDIYSNLKNSNIFSIPKVYVIRDDKTYQTQNKLWEAMISQITPGANIIIFIYTALDARTKFYSAHEKFIVEFEKMSEEVLLNLVVRKIGLDDNRALRLINRCGSDYGKILLEGNKLKMLAAIDNLSVNESFDIAIAENLIPILADGLIDEFINSFFDVDYNSIWFFLDMLKRSGEADMKILAMLYTKIKNILMVQSCSSIKDASLKTGLNSWAIEEAKILLNVFQTEDLLYFMRCIRDTEYAIKTGKIDSEIAVERCLINMLFEDAGMVI